MAVRKSAAERAAEAAEKATPVDTGLPAAWGDDVEEFYGHNLTDKKELIGVPFAIMGIEIERNDGKTYDVAYVYALDINGTEFEFSDTSDTGVRGQVQAILAERQMNPAPGGGFQRLSPKILCRRGLRFSDYTIPNPENPKKKIEAGTYYIAAAGRKPEEQGENGA